ncbi:ABC transporter ATP-binding protein [Humibacter sp.]|uniref:ABC transporter ATP-binding protein n=1 Tax=Humibacter sp. TaxID=1940291 RepID=UPI003F805C67
MSALLNLNGVSKVYPPPAAVAAVSDITFSVGVGESVAITGPSGSGKSTMLGLIGTLERPTSGSLSLDGQDLSRMPDRQLSGLRAWRIGFVFQEFHLLEHLTVLENVMTGLLYRGWTTRRRRTAATAAVEAVGLAARCTHRPSQLSGGERQRVAIARAMAGEPRILLADEPTGNLDSANGRAVMRLIASLADARTTVVVITHDPDVAATMGREIRLRDGRVVADSGRA